MMLFASLSYLILMSLPRSTATSPGAATPDLPPLNNIPFYNASSNSTLSDILTLQTILPYSFSVPNTQTLLRLGFGLPRHRLDPIDLAALIECMQRAIVAGIESDGEDAFPSLNPFLQEQRFGWMLGDGYYFVICSVEESGIFFNWRQLSNVVEGLRLFLVVGERPFATKFKFWDGPGRWRKVLGEGELLVYGDGVELDADE